jgi:hypothetical protein
MRLTARIALILCVIGGVLHLVLTLIGAQTRSFTDLPIYLYFVCPYVMVGALSWWKRDRPRMSRFLLAIASLVVLSGTVAAARYRGVESNEVFVVTIVQWIVVGGLTMILTLNADRLRRRGTAVTRTVDAALIRKSLQQLLVELFEGPADNGTWVLNHDAPGLLAMLETLPAEIASTPMRPDRMTIAAHVNHLRYSLSLLNRWAAGEPDPFATADWNGSWQMQQVNATAWTQLVGQLRSEIGDWIEATQQPRHWDQIALTGAFASAAHAAYHMGAIRQLALALDAKSD